MPSRKTALERAKARIATLDQALALRDQTIADQTKRIHQLEIESTSTHPSSSEALHEQSYLAADTAKLKKAFADFQAASQPPEILRAQRHLIEVLWMAACRLFGLLILIWVRDLLQVIKDPFRYLRRWAGLALGFLVGVAMGIWLMVRLAGLWVLLGCLERARRKLQKSDE